VKIFGVPKEDGQWLYCQDRSGKAAAGGQVAINVEKIFAAEAFTLASPMADSRPGEGEIRGLATKLNGRRALFVLLARPRRSLASESAGDPL
jgi:hypothetical protein